MHNPAVTGAIVGARNAHQAEGVMRAGELRLTDKAVHEIEHFASMERTASTIVCRTVDSSYVKLSRAPNRRKPQAFWYIFPLTGG